MQIGIKEAKNTLSKLVSEAQNGKRVFLTNHGKKVIELVPVDLTAESPNRGFGMLKHLKVPPAFASAEQKQKSTDEIMKLMGLDG